jgi:hypothetical protein
MWPKAHNCFDTILLTVGLWPWDLEIVLARFSREEDQRPFSSDSSRSILQAEDWRRIERLLKQVVSDVYDQNTKKLSCTTHHLSTENILLKLRCQGLENALLNEQKKRQHGKSLALNLPVPEDGNTVFYSSKKVQQARDLQGEKKKAIQLNKTSKEEEMLRRQQEKKKKQCLVKGKKRIRASNRELRILEVERKRR